MTLGLVAQIASLADAERRGITVDTALRLSRFFRSDAQSWLNLQAAYDLRVTELDESVKTAVMAVTPLQLNPA